MAFKRIPLGPSDVPAIVAEIADHVWDALQADPSPRNLKLAADLSDLTLAWRAA